MNDKTNIGETEHLEWRTSSASGGNGDCVEVAPLPNGGAAVRDTKNPDAGIQRYSKSEWRAFLVGVRSGEFDFQ